MWKITLKNLAANKIRLALTAVAIVLGVGFVSSANILSDGLRESFGSLAEEIVQGIDLEVRAEDDNAPFAQSELDTINAVDGVRLAVGSYGTDEVFPIRNDGTLVRPEGPPIFALSWGTDPQLNNTTIEAGRAPTGPGEWVIDMASAEDEGFVVGETYELVVPTPEGTLTAELVGTTRFGADNQTNGAVLMAFDADTLQGMLDRDHFDFVNIAIDGTRPILDVRSDIEQEFTEEAGYLVQDTAQLNAEATAGFNSFISIFAWVLRGFAIVALFVSIFIIANTFNIVMGQRVRELGLLRAVGATPKQVRRAVLGEALVVGLLASLVGIGAGLGIAYGLEAFLNAIGAELPPFDKPLSLNTIGIALAVGVIVTLVSAWLPARRAGRIAPVTAISGTADLDSGGRRMTIFGSILVAFGSVLTGISLFGGIDSTATLLAMLGAGAALLMIGITLLSSFVAAPISRAIGAPIAAIYKRPGVLAKENAARNPKRTATTAAALMIGLSLVSMAFVLGQTLKNDVTALIESTVLVDYAAFPIDGLVPDSLVEELEASPDLTGVVGVRYWGTDVDGTDSEVATMALDQLDASLNLDVTDGSIADVDVNSTAMQTNLAEELGVTVGDTVDVLLMDDSTTELTVRAIFADSTIFVGLLVNEERWDTIGDQEQFDWVAASVAPGSSLEAASASIDGLETEFPQVVIQSAGEYRDDINGQVDQLLMILTGFLALAILIAFIGIVNTMALSIFERTRELGLLRAVGMTRKQTHKMVRWEAAIVSSVGALFGAVLGVVFGVLIVVATPDEALQHLAIPWLSLAGLVIAAGLAGLVAGFLPARRAGKLDVLEAISG